MPRGESQARRRAQSLLSGRSIWAFLLLSALADCGEADKLQCFAVATTRVNGQHGSLRPALALGTDVPLSLVPPDLSQAALPCTQSPANPVPIMRLAYDGSDG